ncbi:MAG: Hpt domain-containing protein, partial [Lachnospiraceae bacterium]|nr:Hpt domain-containing protein [Lachnospiraceae bacterium]
GMDDFLWKPIKKTEMLHILKKWIPADKLKDPPPKKASRAEDNQEENKEFWRTIKKIKGLSISTGLDRVDGQRDVYRQSLKLLIQEIKKSVDNLQEFLAANDAENFRIEVHGIKGALANVGAMGLSAKALTLENASAEMDFGLCALNLPVLINDLNDLGGKLSGAFALLKQSDGAGELSPELSSIFQSMTEAFAEMDLMAIDEGMERLDSLNLKGALKEDIEDIKNMAMMMNYDDAIQSMNKLLDFESAHADKGDRNV